MFWLTLPLQVGPYAYRLAASSVRPVAVPFVWAVSDSLSPVQRVPGGLQTTLQEVPLNASDTPMRTSQRGVIRAVHELATRFDPSRRDLSDAG